MSFNDNPNQGSPWTSFAIGCLVGAGIALLVAPKPGREVREYLVDKGKMLKDKAQEGIDKIKHHNRMGDSSEYASTGTSSTGFSGTTSSGFESTRGKTGKQGTGSDRWSNEGGKNV